MAFDFFPLATSFVNSFNQKNVHGVIHYLKFYFTHRALYKCLEILDDSYLSEI